MLTEIGYPARGRLALPPERGQRLALGVVKPAQDADLHRVERSQTGIERGRDGLLAVGGRGPELCDARAGRAGDLLRRALALFGDSRAHLAGQSR